MKQYRRRNTTQKRLSMVVAVFFVFNSTPTLSYSAELILHHEGGNSIPTVRISDVIPEERDQSPVPSERREGPLSVVEKDGSLERVAARAEPTGREPRLVQSNGQNTRIPGWTAKDVLRDGWYMQNGGVWRTGDGVTLKYDVLFEEAGQHLFTMNVKNIHGPLPDDYRNFDFFVYIDGRVVGSMSVTASDTEWIGNSMRLDIDSPGLHEIGFEWKNDSWDRETRKDANIYIRDLIVSNINDVADDDLMVWGDGRETRVKGKEGVTLGHPSWKVEGDGVWNTNDSRELVYEMTFEEAGLHSIGIKAKNHRYSTLDSDYSHFLVKLTVNGVEQGVVRINASDTEFHMGLFEFEVLDAGTNTIILEWLNDDWKPLVGKDANILISELMLSKTQFTDAAEFRDIFDLRFTGDDARNWSEVHDERWLQGALGRWYYILPSGDLYRWISETADGMTEQDIHIGRVDPIHYEDFTWLDRPTQNVQLENLIAALQGGLDVNADGIIDSNDILQIQRSFEFDRFDDLPPDTVLEEGEEKMRQFHRFLVSLQEALALRSTGNSDFIHKLDEIIELYNGLDPTLENNDVYVDALQMVIRHQITLYADVITTTENRSVVFALLRFLHRIKELERSIYDGLVVEFLETILVKDPLETDAQFDERVDLVHAIWQKHELVIWHERNRWAATEEGIQNQLDDLLRRMLQLDAIDPLADVPSMSLMVFADLETYNKPPGGGFTYSMPLIVLDIRTSFGNFLHEYGHFLQFQDDNWELINTVYKEIYDRSPCPDSPFRVPECHRYTNRNQFEDWAFFYAAWAQRGTLTLQDSLDRAMGVGLEGPAPFYLERILFAREHFWPLVDQGTALALSDYNSETMKFETSQAPVSLNAEGQITQIELGGVLYVLAYDSEGKLISASLQP